jgi:hypothetical protein
MPLGWTYAQQLILRAPVAAANHAERAFGLRRYVTCLQAPNKRPSWFNRLAAYNTCVSASSFKSSVVRKCVADKLAAHRPFAGIGRDGRGAPGRPPKLTPQIQAGPLPVVKHTNVAGSSNPLRVSQ